MLTDTVVQYRQQIESQEGCLEYYREQINAAASTNETLINENERQQLQVTLIPLASDSYNLVIISFV